MLRATECDPSDDGEPVMVCCVACELPVSVMFAEYDRACEVWLCHDCLFHCEQCDGEDDGCDVPDEWYPRDIEDEVDEELAAGEVTA